MVRTRMVRTIGSQQKEVCINFARGFKFARSVELFSRLPVIADGDIPRRNRHYCPERAVSEGLWPNNLNN